MDKSELKDLRAKYPKEHYDVVEKDGKLTVTTKKAVIWLPKKFFKGLPVGNPQKLSDRLFCMMSNNMIDEHHFIREQKVVTLKCAREIAANASQYKTTRQAYIMALLEEHKNNCGE